MPKCLVQSDVFIKASHGAGARVAFSIRLAAGVILQTTSDQIFLHAVKRRPKVTAGILGAASFQEFIWAVAGNMGQVKVTVAICLEILKLTHWQIRLLSKSSLLREVAKRIPAEYKQRVIYGLSTGTLDSGVSEVIEKLTSPVGKRLETLHWLQDNGYRTYGMICPILPQKDELAYRCFAEQIAANINLGKCEHIWAEVLNARGGSLAATSQAFRQAGRHDEADLVDKVAAVGVSGRSHNSPEPV